jgi:hypothetical protein
MKTHSCCYYVVKGFVDLSSRPTGPATPNRARPHPAFATAGRMPITIRPWGDTSRGYSPLNGVISNAAAWRRPHAILTGVTVAVALAVLVLHRLEYPSLLDAYVHAHLCASKCSLLRMTTSQELVLSRIASPTQPVRSRRISQHEPIGRPCQPMASVQRRASPSAVGVRPPHLVAGRALHAPVQYRW